MNAAPTSSESGAVGAAVVVGKVIWINGPVVRARGSQHVGMLDVVEVGEEHLVGEIIGLDGPILTIQVYEETSGLRPGAPVFSTGLPLSVELGPGLISSIFDGIQRPLPVLELRSGAFIGRGIKTTPLYRKQRWPFTPLLSREALVEPGQPLGSVPESPLIEHRILTPPGVGGELVWIAPEGAYTVTEPIASVRTKRGVVEITMLQRWPVRQPRPYRRRLPPNTPLLTGQRVLDSFFPLAKGGAAAIPGGFGSGKTTVQHAIAKWSDAQIVIYVGCGERGNEMTQVLQEFPGLHDPRTGHPVMERTVLVANTSNMPVAAREASIYTGITLAEYYRDMGYHVAMMADSTSRWAEALREISSRLEEMPAEEGYPAYLSTRLASFYERAGRVITLGGAEGSVSLIGAVSPPSDDFSEPVVQQTQRFIRCFWALDKGLAAARHFPAVSWRDSYSEYAAELEDWWQAQGHPQWAALRSQAMELLQREGQLQQIVRLVGADSLPDDQRLVLETARLLREGYLQQDALDPQDAYASPAQQIAMLNSILEFHRRAAPVVAKGCPIGLIHALPIVNTLARLRSRITHDGGPGQVQAIHTQLDAQMRELEQRYGVAAER